MHAGIESKIKTARERSDLYIPIIRTLTIHGDYQEDFFEGMEPGTAGIIIMNVNYDLKSGFRKMEKSFTREPFF